uniref:DNA polymerase epsilon subunit n=1 Tax=Pyrodinium bahamense TaxID=73915 RepID=A0A7S0B8A7_9DINO|mmetsp:Transcript_54486/g.151145  ORF Transcript_54486/g.151145 Transcript_54486/m.151145 type:complete len:550 (+) Transcript_54486:41-1690(+)
MHRAWLREFNASGLQLRPQAANKVTQFLKRCEDPSRVAEALVENTKMYLRSRQGIVESVIDSNVIQSVIDCMLEASKCGGAPSTQDAARQSIEGLDLGDGIHVYNVMMDVKPFDYQRATKEWTPSPNRAHLFPESDAKAKIYADRYHLLLQRLLIEGKVVTEAEAMAGAVLPGQRVLTPVESLVGNPGKKLTFGLITRRQDENTRRWAIEDLHQVYPLDLEVAESDHLMTDGSFVIAEGVLMGDRFRVSHLEVPPAVTRHISESKDQVPAQVFGGSLTDEQLKILAASEHDSPEGMYVILCEVHLDSARVLEKLADVFTAYEDSTPPLVYVFMGSFCSSAFLPTAEGVRSYRDGFERLKFMMQNLTKHVERGTRFIFVPGPKDPGSQTLPRLPLSGYLTSDLAKDIPGVILGTNPCRVRHFSRELVFFRHDVLRLLRRHEVVALREPETGDAPSAQHIRIEMVRFLLDQAHLVPLPLEESNILWSFDHVLRLYPLPHAVFVGGVSQPFDCTYQDCKFCSVGPFHRDSAFYAYYPVSELLETCDVPDRAG